MNTLTPHTSPRLTLIAAVSEDGFISREKGVPWDLPRDRQHFRAITAGHWLLLGRRTYDEMRGWFRDHTPLVLTHDSGLIVPNGHAVRDVAEALALAQSSAVGEIFVCGGSAAYAAAMPYAQRLLITEVQTTLGRGVSFPAISPDEWVCTSSQRQDADAENAHSMRFTEYQRRK